jgi:hypothetical protein
LRPERITSGENPNRLAFSSPAIVHRRALGGKEEMPARFDPTFAADLSGRGVVGLFLGLKAQALCCRAFSPSDRAVCYSAFSPSDRAEGPTARSTGLQPCVRRCRRTRPERSPARFGPTFAADLTGRRFVGLFLGLKAQASCCRAFSPSDRAVCYSAFSPSDRAEGRQVSFPG